MSGCGEGKEEGIWEGCWGLGEGTDDGLVVFGGWIWVGFEGCWLCGGRIEIRYSICFAFLRKSCTNSSQFSESRSTLLYSGLNLWWWKKKKWRTIESFAWWLSPLWTRDGLSDGDVGVDLFEISFSWEEAQGAIHDCYELIMSWDLWISFSFLFCFFLLRWMWYWRYLFHLGVEWFCPYS